MKTISKLLLLCLLFLSKSFSDIPDRPVKITLSIPPSFLLGSTIPLSIDILSQSAAKNVDVVLIIPNGISAIGKKQWTIDLEPNKSVHLTTSLRVESEILSEVVVKLRSKEQHSSLLSAEERVLFDVSKLNGRTLTLKQYVRERGTGSRKAAKILKRDAIVLPPTVFGEMTEPVEPDSAYFNDDTLPSPKIQNGVSTMEATSSGTFSVKGYLVYQHAEDPPGTYRPAVNVTVEVWDYDVTSGDDHLATGITDWSGHFYIGPISNDDCWLCGTQDVYLRFRLTNSRFRVYDFAGYTYWWSTETYDDVPNAEIDFSTRELGGGPYTGAVPIFQFMNLAWNFATTNGGDPGLIAAIYPVSTTQASGNGIQISWNDYDAFDIVVHEYAHAMMYNAYDGWWPPNSTGYHEINRAYNENLAWTEGWADFYPLAVKPDGRFNWEPDDYGWNIETAPYNTDTGPACEARVAGALLDLMDYANDGLDQNSSFVVPFSKFWAETMMPQNHSTFIQFWDYLKYRLNVNQVNYGVQSIQQNTIAVSGLPALSVSISGPSSLGYNQSGTFTANPSGGSGVYTNYSWYKRWPSSGGGGGGGIELPPPDYWEHLEYWEGQSSIQQSSSADFELKVLVTSSDGQVASSTHYVSIGGFAKRSGDEDIKTTTPSRLPAEFYLEQNYPNPFNPETEIRFQIPEAVFVSLAVFDIAGREVAKLKQEFLPPGFHKVSWMAKDVPSGIYIYALRAGKFISSRRMILLK